MDISREDHLQQSKDRALALVEQGDFDQAIASMISDLKKHPQISIHPKVEQALLISILFKRPDKRELIKWINGFN
jgi:hypothetical protein